jgi:hypothetical protein
MAREQGDKVFGRHDSDSTCKILGMTYKLPMIKSHLDYPPQLKSPGKRRLSILLFTVGNICDRSRS